jgi:predicted acyltransferase
MSGPAEVTPTFLSAQTSDKSNSLVGEAAPDADSTQLTVSRLISLDALRGFDMFWIMGGDMILRSLPKIHDSTFTRALAAQMEHCEWSGFHFYDLIFPLFVFIVGVSLVFSLSRMLERSGRLATLKRIFIRSIVLFLLGIFYMGGIANGFKNVYFAGVLHRIALAYFFTGLIFCFFRPRAMILFCLSLLIGYCILMTIVPVPGSRAPSLAEPGNNLAHCFQWNTARTKTPLWACCDLRQKCYDLCYDLDLKNHSVLPSLLRRYYLQGDHLPTCAA